jgi:hypothetical protein
MHHQGQNLTPNQLARCAMAAASLTLAPATLAITQTITLTNPYSGRRRLKVSSGQRLKPNTSLRQPISGKFAASNHPRHSAIAGRLTQQRAR